MKKVLTGITQDGTFTSEFLAEMSDEGGRRGSLPGKAPHGGRAAHREGGR